MDTETKDPKPVPQPRTCQKCHVLLRDAKHEYEHNRCDSRACIQELVALFVWLDNRVLELEGKPKHDLGEGVTQGVEMKHGD